MRNNGFSIIEVVLAISIAALAVSVFVGGLLYASDTLVSRYVRVQARLSASECLTVVFWLRDTEGFDSLAEGVHGLALDGGSWELSEERDVNGTLTRSVAITETDEHTKDIACTMTWETSLGEHELVMESRVTAWNE